MISTTNTQLSSKDYESKIKSLEQELSIAKAANTEIQGINDSLSERVKAIELESRTAKIASIVSGAYDNADEKVASFIKSGLSIEEISNIVSPLKKTKSASYISQVAIKNEPVKNNGWQNSYLDLIQGGSA